MNCTTTYLLKRAAQILNQNASTNVLLTYTTADIKGCCKPYRFCYLSMAGLLWQQAKSSPSQQHLLAPPGLWDKPFSLFRVYSLVSPISWTLQGKLLGDILLHEGTVVPKCTSWHFIGCLVISWLGAVASWGFLLSVPSHSVYRIQPLHLTEISVYCKMVNYAFYIYCTHGL